MGCSFWDPVQSSNDELAIKQKYGNNLALCGGPESRFYDEDTTEEEVKSDVREYIMKLAPGGGFAMFAFVGDIDEDNPPMPGMTKAEINRLRWTGQVFDELRWDMYK
jgi:hypothetical protein